MRHTRLLSSLLLTAAAGCSSASGAADSGDAATSCPSAPESCPSRVPSYASDIAPILQQSCVPCHGPGGSAGHSEATYDAVHAQVSPILDVVAGCTMPPSSYPPLRATERTALLDWLVCGAPNN